MYFQTFYNLHAKNVFVDDSAKKNVTQLSRLDVQSADVRSPLPLWAPADVY